MPPSTRPSLSQNSTSASTPNCMPPGRQSRKTAPPNCMPPSTRPSLSQNSTSTISTPSCMPPGTRPSSSQSSTSTSTPNCMPPSTRPSISQITFPYLLEVRTPIAFSYLGKNGYPFSNLSNLEDLDSTMSTSDQENLPIDCPPVRQQTTRWLGAAKMCPAFSCEVT